MKTYKLYAAVALLLSMLLIAAATMTSCYSNASLFYKINDDGKTCIVVGCNNADNEDVYIPETYEGYTVIGIAENAFKDQQLKSVTLPSTLNFIGEGAFYGCTSLKNVYGLENCLLLKEMRYNTFFDCGSLENIVLPPNLISIGEQSFLGCVKLSSIELPDSLQTIGISAFAGCSSLSGIDFPDSVTDIGGMAFVLCSSLKEVTLPPRVSNLIIPFGYCTSLENIFVSDNCLNYSSIDGVLFNKDLSKIVCYPSGRNRETYIIPNTVNHIEVGAFSSNPYLKEITIPKSVLTIDGYIFGQSDNISIINYIGTVAEWNKIEKAINWNAQTDSVFSIVCSDGTIAMDGTVTYK